MATGGEGPTDEGDAKKSQPKEKTGAPAPAPATGGEGPTDEGDA
jgi:hypothetical protein